MQCSTVPKKKEKKKPETCISTYDSISFPELPLPLSSGTGKGNEGSGNKIAYDPLLLTTRSSSRARQSLSRVNLTFFTMPTSGKNRKYLSIQEKA